MQQTFPDGLSAPMPFGKNSVANRDDKIRCDLQRAREVRTQNSKNASHVTGHGGESNDATEIDRAGEEARQRTREQKREGDSFRRVNRESVSVRWNHQAKH